MDQRYHMVHRMLWQYTIKNHMDNNNHMVLRLYRTLRKVKKGLGKIGLRLKLLSKEVLTGKTVYYHRVVVAVWLYQAGYFLKFRKPQLN